MHLHHFSHQSTHQNIKNNKMISIYKIINKNENKIEIELNKEIEEEEENIDA